MQVHKDIDHLPQFKNAVVTIGTFDGVHTGHVKVIEQLKAAAGSIAGETVIITFHPHPRMVLRSLEHEEEGYLINTLEEKIQLIGGHGIDHLVIVPFTAEFAEQTAEDYIHKFLVEKFNPSIIIIGYDHHFGKNRGGNYKLLEAKAFACNYKVQEIPKYLLDDIAISSTRIREAILSGNIAIANKFLGYDYFFSGSVIHGDKIGRTLGYPTVNIEMMPFKLIPGNGIYIVTISIANETFSGMMSIGIRPTVGGTKKTIEVNIFDFQQDVYGSECTVQIKKYIRPEIKFDGLEALISRMKEDEKISKDYFRQSV